MKRDDLTVSFQQPFAVEFEETLIHILINHQVVAKFAYEEFWDALVERLTTWTSWQGPGITERIAQAKCARLERDRQKTKQDRRIEDETKD